MESIHPISKKGLIGAFICLLIISAYNSLRLRNDSFMNETASASIKRLDEISDIRIAGRSISATGSWTSLKKEEKKAVVKRVAKVDKKPVAAKIEDAPIVDGFVNLHLVEVYNSKKYPEALDISEFSGSLELSGNSIETMNVQLPGERPLEIYYSEIIGSRTFRYEIDYKEYSGVIFESEDGVFVASFVNGPMKGTRLKFAKELPESANEVKVVKNEEPKNIEKARFTF